MDRCGEFVDKVKANNAFMSYKSGKLIVPKQSILSKNKASLTKHEHLKKMIQEKISEKYIEKEGYLTCYSAEAG
jgi:hypothetical protein